MWRVLKKCMGGLCAKIIEEQKLTASTQPKHEENGVFAQAREPEKCSNKVVGLETISR